MNPVPPTFCLFRVHGDSLKSLFVIPCMCISLSVKVQILKYTFAFEMCAVQRGFTVFGYFPDLCVCVLSVGVLNCGCCSVYLSVDNLEWPFCHCRCTFQVFSYVFLVSTATASSVVEMNVLVMHCK